MKSIIARYKPSKGAHCDVCTAKSTVVIFAGKEYNHSLNAYLISLCDDCAKTMVKQIQDALTIERSEE